MQKRICIGILTFCDDQKSPKRFSTLKRALESYRGLSRPDTFIYVWDNNSSENVKEYLRGLDFLDGIYFSEKNLYDLVAVNFLEKKAKELDAEFVCYLEDDFLFYDLDFLDDSYQFMDNNTDCGSLRILKYNFQDRDRYDKLSNHPNKDKPNCQRHYNQNDKQRLVWEDCGTIGAHHFYKNNWHWYSFPTITRTEVFSKIIPKIDCRPLQGMEGFIMKKYHELGLKVGVMDFGVVTHLAGAGLGNSQRIAFEKKPGSAGYPIVKYSEIYDEICNIKNELEEYND